MDYINQNKIRIGVVYIPSRKLQSNGTNTSSFIFTYNASVEFWTNTPARTGFPTM